MNTCPLPLPSELMATCSIQHLETSAFGDIHNFGACDEISKISHHHSADWPLHVQVLDDAPTWSFASSSSPNYDQCHNPSELLDDVPDLSHTPLSCHSNDSSTTSTTHLPLNLISEQCLPAYVPDLDLSNESYIFKDHYDPPAFPDPSFAWVDSTEEPTNTIHSPKPVFGYKTFQFDLERLDRSSSTPKIGRQRAYSEGDVNAIRKRRRDEEDDEEAGHSKKRRMSQDMPQLFPIFPDYNCNPPTSWRRCSFSDEPCTIEAVPTMEQLFDDMYGWDDVAWSSAFRFTITSPAQP